MTSQEEFIEQIAPYIEYYRGMYDVQVVAAIIAQSCLESKYGTSELALYTRNIFGLKWHESVSGGGKYLKVGSEQKPDGSYVSSVMEWCTFTDFKASVHGYFEFLFNRAGITRYANLRGIKDTEEYLRKVKEDGYCTSQNYVENCMRIVEAYDLINRFDPYPTPQPEPEPTPEPTPAPTGYSNSPLVTYVDLTPNYNPRSDANKYGCVEGNDRLTIHHMAGSYGVETCGKLFHNKSGSSNYGIDPNNIAMFVEEKNRAWTSSNRYNDFRGITIEVANTPEGVANNTWEIAPESYTKLINLSVDIAKRNGKTKVIEISDELSKISYADSKDKIAKYTAYANNYQVPAGTMLMTQHNYFASTVCPGPYIKQLWKQICSDINARLSGVTPEPTPTPVPAKPVAAKPTVKNGSRGTEAKNLQADLNFLGYTDGKGSKLTEDGIFGACSVQALKKFQGNNGLVADGIYGNGSYNKMVERLSI